VFWKWLQFLLAMLVFFTLAACGGNEVQPELTLTVVSSSTPSPEPTKTPELTHTPRPTETPITTTTLSPTLTATITPTPTPQAGESRINPETGLEEVFSNAYGWVEANELGTLIEEDGVIKVMTEQGLLPFSDQITERLKNDLVDLSAAEVILADKFVQIVNILVQINTSSDQVIYGKDSQIFQFDERLINTINDELVIMSRYGKAIFVWDDETNQWVEPVRGSLDDVAPSAVRIDSGAAYDSEGRIIARMVDGSANELWYGILPSIEGTRENIADFLYGLLSLDVEKTMLEHGQLRPISWYSYDLYEDMGGYEVWDENGELVGHESIDHQRLVTAPMILGGEPLSSGEGVIMAGAIDQYGVPFAFPVSVGFDNHPEHEFFSEVDVKFEAGNNPNFEPETPWGTRTNVRNLWDSIPAAVGRNSRINIASEILSGSLFTDHIGAYGFSILKNPRDAADYAHYYLSDVVSLLFEAYLGGNNELVLRPGEDIEAYMRSLESMSAEGQLPYFNLGVISQGRTANQD